jgi:hypothetical protein
MFKDVNDLNNLKVDGCRRIGFLGWECCRMFECFDIFCNFDDNGIW